MTRELWATRIGLVLAMAGNAIGLGNFLRFPVQAVNNGGGAFMIAYVICFLVLGIPLMWFEWAMGRYGGHHGHGSMPAIFHLLWNHPLSRYLALIGLVGPLLIAMYYLYIESWTLAYALSAFSGNLPSLPADVGLREALAPFRDFFEKNLGVHSETIRLTPSLLFLGSFVVVLFLNFLILRRGVAKGIELLARIGMPLLFLLAFILVIRVLTLGSPVSPETSALKGLNFLWEPRWDQLGNFQVWLAAAGQIFFTLSLGMGAIPVYASYVKRKQDIVISGLSSASLNEFAEVILGGSIAIPAAVAFFGLTAAQEIAREGGAFRLGFYAIPAVFSFMHLGTLFGTLWFFLLFLAALTSSVALLQPGIAFLQDDLRMTRGSAVSWTIGFVCCGSLTVLFIRGVLDSLDFWVGTFLITLFALLELIVFVWIFGSSRACAEVLEGAQVSVPPWLLRFLAITATLLTAAIVIMGTKAVLPKLVPTSLGEWVGIGIIGITFLSSAFLVHFASRSWERKL